MGNYICSKLKSECVDAVQMNSTFLFSQLCHTTPYNTGPSYQDDKNSINTPSLPITFNLIEFERGLVQAPLAIVLSDSGGTYNKIQFWIETDRYSLLEISNTASSKYFNTDIIFKAEFGGFTTSTLHRAQKVNGSTYIATYWNIIIVLDNGIVSDIFWDNTCNDCSNSNCIYNEQCSIPIESCKGSTNCNFKVCILNGNCMAINTK